MVNKLTVEIKEINTQALDELQQKWLALESTANNSIFTSWHWISTWLLYINFSAKLLQVNFGSRIVGLAFVSQNDESKYTLYTNQLWLNRTGNTLEDQIWNEYNDVLCENGLEYAIRSAVLHYFAKELSQVDEFIIGVSNKTVAQTPLPKELMQHTSWKTTSYSTILQPEYAQWSQYLQSLSKNTRRQIKRSANLFGGIDNINLLRANSTEQAINYFNDAGEYHKRRWANQHSGFENSYFVNFHHQLIKNNFDAGSIDIIKIQVEDKTICYLYNLIYKNTVYFYLSGIEYTQDNRLKPGLLSHSIAIAYYAALGYEEYDFMGGEGRYKNSLSNKKSAMIISNFRRKSLPFLASDMLRQLKKNCAKTISHFK